MTTYYIELELREAFQPVHGFSVESSDLIISTLRATVVRPSWWSPETSGRFQGKFGIREPQKKINRNFVGCKILNI